MTCSLGLTHWAKVLVDLRDVQLFIAMGLLFCLFSLARLRGAGTQSSRLRRAQHATRRDCFVLPMVLVCCLTPLSTRL